VVEIAWHGALLPPSLIAYPAYGINSPLWDSFVNLERDLKHRAGFIGNDEYNYATPRTHVKDEEEG
jgi:hypothetical protein